MRYLVSIAIFSVLASGCTLVFDDAGDDECLLPAAEPAIAPAPQRNPDSLTCESFGGGFCNPECGPCPLSAVPLPSWGFCGSTCEALSETACEQEAGCRVVKDAACAVSGDCATDFLGCFPTDQAIDPQVDCLAARDGSTCSRNPACTAFHRGRLSTTLGPPEDFRPFEICMPEGKLPGTCFGQVTCARAAPSCPTSYRPGIESGCYTGACIPMDLCELP
jgi:hypothetical protein